MNHFDKLLLEAAQAGYRGHYFDGEKRSEQWLAWQAGRAVCESGRTEPVKCTTFRKTSIKIETSGGMELKIRFDKINKEVCGIERLN